MSWIGVMAFGYHYSVMLLYKLVSLMNSLKINYHWCLDLFICRKVICVAEE